MSSSQSSFDHDAQADLDPTKTTIGIEMEVYLLCPKVMFSSPLWEEYTHPELELLRQRFELDQLPVNSVSAHLESDSPPDYNKWTINHRSHRIKNCEWDILPETHYRVICKISSPRFLLSDEKSWKSSLKRVDRVFMYLSNVGIRVVTNNECGLHCHIGNSAAPIPLQTAKNLLKVVVGFERCFDLLHASPRTLLSSTCGILPMSRFFRDKEDKLLKWMDVIENQMTSLETLKQFFTTDQRETREEPTDQEAPKESDSPDSSVSSENDNPRFSGKDCAYNFDNLKSNDPLSKNTIEFRQHHGTLSIDAISNWVKLCAALVHASARMTQTDLSTLLRDHIHDLDFDIFTLFDKLKVPAAVAEYYRKRIGIYQAVDNKRLSFGSRPQSTYMGPTIIITRSNPNPPWHGFLTSLHANRSEELDSMDIKSWIALKFYRGHYGSWPGGYEDHPDWDGPTLPDLGRLPWPTLEMILDGKKSGG